MNIHVYDGATPHLRRIAELVRSRKALMRVAGGELRDALRDHFRGRGHRIYARIARDTQLDSVTDAVAVVAIGGESGPILWHKINGGWVKAKTVGKLAIPSQQNKRRDVWPRNYPEGALVPLFGRNGVYALADAKALKKQTARAKRTEKAATRADKQAARYSGLRGGARQTFIRSALARRGAARRDYMATTVRSGAILFFLKERVFHRADPRAMPDQYAVEARVMARVRTEFAAQIAGAGG